MTHIKSKLNDHRQEVIIVVDLDKVSFVTNTALPITRIDFIQGGKRVTVGISLYQTCTNDHPTIAMSICNWVTCEAQIRPWIDMEEPKEM